MPPKPPDDKDKRKPHLRIAKDDDNAEGPHPTTYKRKLTGAERYQVMSVIETKVIDGERPANIYETLRNAHEKGIPTGPDTPRAYFPYVSKPAFKKMLQEVESLLEDDRVHRPNRLQLVDRTHARWMRHMRNASSARNFHAVARFEEMIAKLHGMFIDKQQIQVSFAQSEHVARILSEGDDFVRQLSQEQGEVTRKAALYDQITSFEAIGEPIDSPRKEPEVALPALPERVEPGDKKSG